ncbi:MAG TPA: Smr/MutS family protein [Xanthobacteraceae bacterium]|nr:Smr/MutS family protein [Xanthobacteraceae bacterium]
MSRRRPVSDEEEALWATIARSVKPLRKAKAIAKPPAKPTATPPATAEHQEAPPAPSRPVGRAERTAPAERAPHPLQPLDRRFKQRVARGHNAIAARLDLHGMTQRQAHAALIAFLRQAQDDDARIVLVVTGKGSGKIAHDGGERGILRRQVPMWLALPEFRRFVVGFDEAHAGHGGQGALYVRLRRARST